MLDHQRQVIVADLIPEAPGAAVDHDADLAGLEAEGRGGVFVIDLRNDLDLEEMVSRAERPELIPAPLQRPVAHLLRIGPRHRPPVLRRLQIRLGAVPVPDRPGRALREDLPLLPGGKFQGAPGADAGGDVLIQGRDEGDQTVADVLPAQTGGQQAAAAVDIVTDAAGRDDPLLHCEGRDPADGKAVPPVHVGHRERGRHDPRQVGHVRHLPGTLVGAHPLHELFAGVDDPGDAHCPLPGDLPPPVVDLAQRGLRHPTPPFPTTPPPSGGQRPGDR